MRAQAAQQPLGDDAYQGRREHIIHNTQITQAHNGAKGIVGMQTGEHQVAGLGCAHGLGRGFFVANFTDQNHVRILAQKAADRTGKINPGFVVHFHLADQGHLVLNRIFDGEDVFFHGVDAPQHTVQTGGLAATRRPGYQDGAVRAGSHGAQHIQLMRIETDIFQRNQFAAPDRIRTTRFSP